MKKTVLFLTSLGFLLFFSLLPAEETPSYKVIVHLSNPISSMTKELASKLFLKKVSKWDNGHPVLPVDLTEASSVRERLSKELHGKSVAAIKGYWQQKIFSGRDIPPLEKGSDAEVLSYVRANPDAIGYVSGNATAENVKVVKITP